MNTPTIEMERAVAVEKLEAYEQAARSNPRAYRDIDKGLIEGYRALAKGRRLIDVNDAIRAGGLNLAGQPKLAIARAHAEKCFWERIGGSEHTEYYWHDHSRWSDRYLSNRFRWRTEAGLFAAEKLSGKRVSAMLPLVPLPLRPKYKLENYFILWEANWHPEPPRDPYLLRPLTGSLMEIIAEWNLTDLEIAAVRNAAVRR